MAKCLPLQILKGGESYSKLEIDDGVAKFTGKCAIVPSLKAPGFITMETGSQFYQKPVRMQTYDEVRNNRPCFSQFFST